MSKNRIQSKFQIGNELYTLVYFPDPNDPTQLEPNYSLMQGVTGGTNEIMLPTGDKKHMSWARTIIPANQGTMSPQKNFLLFALQDVPVNPDYIKPNSMICYAVQDMSTGGGNVQQQFINHLFGAQDVQKVQENIENDWATNIFETPEMEVVSDDDTSTTEKV